MRDHGDGFKAIEEPIWGEDTRGRKCVTWFPPPADWTGPLLNGRKPYEKGDELVQAPEPIELFQPEHPFHGSNYFASSEDASRSRDPDDAFQPDEDLLQGAVDGDLEKVKAALNDGADITLENWPWKNTVLHLANSPRAWDADTWEQESEARLELTKYLVRQGADLHAVNSFNCSAIDLAIFNDYTDTVDFLEEQGCKLGLLGAAYEGDLDRVKALLEEGIDIDMVGRLGRTAWFEAKLQEQHEVYVFLEQQGCSKFMSHNFWDKFNPGGSSIPNQPELQASTAERQYYRVDCPEWYDDMMEKRFPGHLEKLALAPPGWDDPGIPKQYKNQH